MKTRTALVAALIVLSPFIHGPMAATEEECPTSKEGSRHGNLGTHLWESGELTSAEKETREAIKNDPDCSMWHQNLGVILNALGRTDEARDSWIKSLELDKYWCSGKRTESLYALGQYSYKHRDYKRSIEYFEKALQNAEDEEVSDDVKGTILVELSYNYTEPKELGNPYYNLGKAEELKRKALLLKPGDLFVKASITKLLVLQGKLSEAKANIDELVAAQSQSPRPNPGVYSYLGHIYSLLDDPSHSSEYMQRAMDVDPAQAQYLLSELDKDFRQVAAAKEMQPVIQRARELTKK